MQPGTTASPSFKGLIDTLPQRGKVVWIGVRPARAASMVALQEASIDPEQGLEGDRFSGAAGSPRQLTLIQHEHLAVIGSCLGRAPIEPALLRRNIVVSGLNLLALKGKRFQVGAAVLEWTGQCHPCSKMERLLGAGGYNAMRGHGGITARVVRAGRLQIGDPVAVPAHGLVSASG